MAVCARYGIAHSAFLGWDPDDRDKAIWWELRERDRCPGCGTRQEEWDEDRGGDRDAYRAEVHRCRGCQVRATKQAEVSRDDLGDGVHVVLVKRPRRRQAAVSP